MYFLYGVAEQKRIQNTVSRPAYELIAKAYSLSYRITAGAVAAEVVQTLRRLMRRFSSGYGNGDGIGKPESLLPELIVDYRYPER
jgi:hypothetical protein